MCGLNVCLRLESRRRLVIQSRSSKINCSKILIDIYGYRQPSGQIKDHRMMGGG